MRPPRPNFYKSPARPSCPPILVGVAVSQRDRALFLQLNLVGFSAARISRLPFIGRNVSTIRRILRRAKVAGGTLEPRPRGGAANSPPILSPPALLYLRVRVPCEDRVGALTQARHRLFCVPTPRFTWTRSSCVCLRTWAST